MHYFSRGNGLSHFSANTWFLSLGIEKKKHVELSAKILARVKEKEVWASVLVFKRMARDILCRRRFKSQFEKK